MSRNATATLQTPWDCKWSRFGRMRSTRPNTTVEGLWVCVYGNAGRRPIDESDCATCPYWEYDPPFGHGAVRRAKPDGSVHSTEQRQRPSSVCGGASTDGTGARNRGDN